MEIEPLAIALAELSDRAEQSIIAQEEASKRQAAEWTSYQKKSADQWTEVAKEMNKAANGVWNTTDKARETIGGLGRRIWLWVLMASLTPILVLLIVLLILFNPSLTEQDGISYLIIRLGW
ncbi:IncQ-type mobilization protein MobB [Oceanisphaera sp. IT1-181]|uniref:IncQ-type mobilization protein MobB n=1 Tax=Oceanisphaera sp. IT1-181 TaxID=3081199 RepID=UPI0039B55A70